MHSYIHTHTHKYRPKQLDTNTQRCHCIPVILLAQCYVSVLGCGRLWCWWVWMNVGTSSRGLFGSCCWTYSCAPAVFITLSSALVAQSPLLFNSVVLKLTGRVESPSVDTHTHTAFHGLKSGLKGKEVWLPGRHSPDHAYVIIINGSFLFHLIFQYFLFFY